MNSNQLMDQISKTVNNHYAIRIGHIDDLAPGSYNKVYVFSAIGSEERYLLKQYNHGGNFDPANIKASLAVQSYVATACGLTPSVIRCHNGDLSVVYEDRSIAIMDFAEGKRYDRRDDVPDEDWQELATAMGEVHKVLKDCPDLGAKKIAFNFPNKKDLLHVDSTVRTEALRQIEQALRLQDHVGSRPEQVIHGDPSIDNWLFTTNGPFIIDWDTVLLGHVEYDLFFFGDKRLGPFMKNYKTAYPTTLNRDALKFYMLVHQLNLLTVRIHQAIAGKLEPDKVSKYFLSLAELDSRTLSIIEAAN